jgi:lipopolysaccharide export system permease protein
MKTANSPICRSFITTHLFRYLALRLFILFAALYALFFAIIYTVDVIEMSRRFSEHAALSFAPVAVLSLYRVPFIMGDMTLFMIMLATMGTLMSLEQRRELVIIRAMGLSPWQYLQSGLYLTFTVGLFFSLFYAPLSAHYKKQAELLETAWTHTSKKTSSALWFEDVTPQGRLIIHGEGFEHNTGTLLHPQFFLFDSSHAFQTRYHAQKASLDKGKWILNNSQELSPSVLPHFYEHLELPTALTPDRLSLTLERSPESLSFWELSDIIRYRKKMGSNTLSYELRQAKILFQTPLLIAAFLIAAAFSLGYSRLNHPLWRVLKVMGVGFIFYALLKMIEDMGIAGFINPWIATLIMPIIGSIGAALLLMKKEGA